jgi:diguanylate cyclase (GGDEF)-like protein
VKSLALEEATIRVRRLLRSSVSAAARYASRRAWTRSHHWLTVPVLLLALCFSAVCGWVLLEARRATEARAAEVATSLASSLRSDIARNVESLNLSLEAVVNNLKLPDLARLSPEMRQHVLFDHSSTARYLTSILVVDETGRITLDSRNLSPSQQNLSDRDYFQVHRDNDSLGLFISRPFVSRLSGRVLVAFSRRLSHPDGSFAGVVLGAMLQSYFQSVFKDISLGPNGTVTLARTDGIVLMRWPYREDFIGSNVKRADLFVHFPHAASGHYESWAVSDGIKRLFVYTQVDDLPLIIVVGQSLDDIFAPWWRQALGIGALMIALCAVTVMLAGFLNRELTRRSAAERKLTILATMDGLTGLANRRHFNRTLAYEWRRATRSRAPVALLMIDADNFKLYNDSHGHQAGDKLLQRIAASIAANVRRPSDLGARFGGDEFSVLLPDTSLEEAAALAERIRGDLVLRCSADEIQRGSAQLSIGVACLAPGAEAKHRDLVAAADKALYQAKHHGRNRTELAETDSGGLAPDAGADSGEGNSAAPVRPSAAAELQRSSAP